MSQVRHGLSIDGCIALSDEELAVRLYDAIGKVPADADTVIDELYFLVDEALERFAPHVVRATVLHHWRDAKPDDLLDALEAPRRRQAARLLRDTIGGNDG